MQIRRDAGLVRAVGPLGLAAGMISRASVTVMYLAVQLARTAT